MNRHRVILLGSALRVVSVGSATLIGFFLMPFLVHRLGDRMYGYWALVGAVLGYYGILDLGITPAVQFQVAKAIGERNGESPNRALSTAVVAFAVLGLIALAITILVAACCPLFIPNPADAGVFRAVLVIMGINVAFGFPGRAFVGAVNAHLRNDLSALVTIFVSILRTSLIVGVILKGGGLISLALVSLLTDLPWFLAHYLILHRIQKGLRISITLADRSTFKELFDYGRFTVINQVGDQLRFAIDGWMVAAFVGVAAVAHYTIASRLANYFLVFVISAVGLLPPWFSQLLGNRDHDGIRKVLALGTRFAAALSTIILVSLVLYGRAFIFTWMGPSYVDAYWPSIILVAAMFCDLAQQPSVGYLQGVFQHRYLAFQTLAEGVANFVLSIYWARSHGMIGVAMGTLVPMVVAKLFLQPPYVCRSAGLSLARYYIKDFGAGVVAPALSGVALWAFLLRRLELSSLWEVCLVVVLQAFVCALISFYFVFGSEDKRRVLNALWPRHRMDGAARASANVSLDLREP